MEALPECSQESLVLISWYSLSWCTHEYHEYHEIMKNICQLTLLKLLKLRNQSHSSKPSRAKTVSARLMSAMAPCLPARLQSHLIYILQIKSQPPAAKNDVLKCSVLSYYSAGISEYWAAYCSLCCVSWDLGQHEIRTLNIPGPVGITDYTALGP